MVDEALGEDYRGEIEEGAAASQRQGDIEEVKILFQDLPEPGELHLPPSPPL